MQIQQNLYMVHLKRGSASSYYSRGISSTNIFHPGCIYDTISIQKITFANGNSFVHDLYPALYRFLRAIKLYFKYHKSPRFIRQRQLTGCLHVPFHYFLRP
jgi:hypothetical protein